MQEDHRPCAPIPGEPCFTLLGRDIHAPGLVRAWADEREDAIARGQAPESDRARVQNAHDIARQMEAWRKANVDAAPWRAPMPLFPEADEGEAMVAAFTGPRGTSREVAEAEEVPGAKTKWCGCAACQSAPHLSSCAVHNAPALPVGPCDCGAQRFETATERRAAAYNGEL